MIVNFDGKFFNFDEALTVKEIFKRLGLNKEIYLVVLEDGNLATPDRVVGKNETVKIIRVVSGG